MSGQTTKKRKNMIKMREEESLRYNEGKGRQIKINLKTHKLPKQSGLFIKIPCQNYQVTMTIEMQIPN